MYGVHTEYKYISTISFILRLRRTYDTYFALRREFLSCFQRDLHCYRFWIHWPASLGLELIMTSILQGASWNHRKSREYDLQQFNCDDTMTSYCSLRPYASDICTGSLSTELYCPQVKIATKKPNWITCPISDNTIHSVSSNILNMLHEAPARASGANWLAPSRSSKRVLKRVSINRTLVTYVSVSSECEIRQK